jgi:hypothetical protein
MRKIDSKFKVCFLTVSPFFYEEYRRRYAYGVESWEVINHCQSESYRLSV